MDHFHKLSDEQLRTTEAEPFQNLRADGCHVVQYAKTRPVFDGYKAARYSKNILPSMRRSWPTTGRPRLRYEHQLLGGEKLPKMDALKKNAANWRHRKRLYANTARPSGNAGGRGGQGQHRSSARAYGRASEKGTGAIAHGDGARTKYFWSQCPEVQRVWGAPQQAFLRPAPAKIAGVATLALACRLRATRNMARKNGGHAFLRFLRFFTLLSSLGLVASTSFNSLSFKEFNMALIRFLQLAPHVGIKVLIHRYIKHCYHLIKGVEAWMLAVIFVIHNGTRIAVNNIGQLLLRHAAGFSFPLDGEPIS